MRIWSIAGADSESGGERARRGKRKLELQNIGGIPISFPHNDDDDDDGQRSHGHRSMLLYTVPGTVTQYRQYTQLQIFAAERMNERMNVATYVTERTCEWMSMVRLPPLPLSPLSW